MFQLEEGIQTECQGLSQAQETKREVCSNGEDDSNMLLHEPDTHSFNGQRYFCKESGLE